MPGSVDKQPSGSNKKNKKLIKSAIAVALELKLEPRTVQRLYETWKEDPDSLFNTIGSPRIIEPEELAEATKSLVSDFYYKYPTATIDQLIDQMTSSFKDLIISKKNALPLYGL
ncbi:hypothetical protein BDF21DRAFT_421683 [Thamnidium elegans]|nr:hypothetical protein BDF21DRAFT_421683 [Thamnidium elegans]